MFSLSRLYVLTVQCSQNPSPPGMNDMSASVLSPRVWLITRLFSTLFSASPLWKKIDWQCWYFPTNHPRLITGILRTDVSYVKFPALISRHASQWQRSSVAISVSTACMLRAKFSFFLSPWPEVFGKSSSLNVCCAATIFYPYQYNMKWKGLCFLKALDSVSEENGYFASLKLFVTHLNKRKKVPCE